MVIQRVTPLALPTLRHNIFTGTFNVPTLGVYDFNTAANTSQVIVNDLDPRYYYLMDKFSFAGTILEGVYLESLDTDDIPAISFSYQSQPSKIFPFPYPMVNYIDGLDWSFWFRTKQEDDKLLISLTGTLDQVAATVGTPNIKLNTSYVIYKEASIPNVETLIDSEFNAVNCFNS